MQEEKTSIRKKMLAKNESYCPADKKACSQAIQKSLLALNELKNSNKVCLFLHKNGEVETIELAKKFLAAGKKVIVPVTDLKAKKLILSQLTDLSGLAAGAFNVLEPKQKTIVDPQEIDLLILPGVAFDEKCNRLGRGQGFYDKLIKELKPETLKIGLAFDFQVIQDVPVNELDEPLDLIVTEKRIIRRNQE